MKRKSPTSIAVLLLLFAAIAPAAHAEDKKDDDWMKGRLFAPELLLAHRAELNLSDAQRARRREIVGVQSRVPEIDYELLDRAAAVQSLMDRRPIDARAVLAEVEKMLATENRKKLLYLEMLVNLRNMLTPAQIDAARQLSLKQP
ncbi:MAG: hypothetical protein U1F30_11565 [Steroidobacteraceae bacterium]